MVGVVAADDDLLGGLAEDLPIGADEPDIGIVRLGPAGGEEDMVQIARREFGHLVGQRDHRHMRRHEEGVVIGQLFHLPVGHFGQLVTAIADVHAPQPRHRVEDLLALAVGQGHPGGAGDHPCAFFRKNGVRGERMHVVGSVQRLQLGGGHVIRDLVHLGLLGSESRFTI